MSTYRYAEEWRPVAWAPGYEVSNVGRARSVARTITDELGRVRRLRSVTLAPVTNRSGHLSVQLRARGVSVRVYIHRLVLEAFIGPCPDGYECCHRNDDPTDNRLVNLYWGTRRDNMLDQVANDKHPWSRRTHCSRGHEFTARNTFVTSSGGRGCRECRRRHNLDYRARKAAARVGSAAA